MTHKHNTLFLHCKNCMNSKFEISLDDKGMYIACPVCAEITAIIGRDDLGRVIDEMFTIGCTECSKNEYKN